MAELSEKEIEKRKASIKKYYEIQCEKYRLDKDNWDVETEVDINLTPQEIKNQVDNFIKETVPILSRVTQATVQEQKRYEAEIQQHIIDEIQENNKEYFRRINTEPEKTLDRIDAPIHNAVSKLIMTNSPLLIIEGKHGTGKSFAIDQQIAREGKGDSTNIYTTRITQAYLYRLGFVNKEKGKLLILRDVNPFRKDVLDTIKALTDTNEPRIIYKNSYSKPNADLPSQYQFEGSVIIEVNATPTETDIKSDMDAILSRSIHVPFFLSQQEIKAKMLVIAKEDWQKKVTEFISKIPDVDVNLRTQYHAFKTYQWCTSKNIQWEEVMEEEMRKISVPKVYWKIYSIIGENWVSTASLVKSLVCIDNVSVRQAYRTVEELEKGEILHRNEKFVGLKPLKCLTPIPTSS